MLTTITAARRTLTAIRTRAIAAHHLGAPWSAIVRAAIGDARAFAATPHRLAPPAVLTPAAHYGARGVRE
jgi:hypothetical protein